MTAARPKSRQPKIDWSVDPYIGVGPVRFGMSSGEVATILGLPLTRIERVKGFVEYRETIVKTSPVITYEGDKVALIDFYKLAKTLRLGDLALFGGKRQAILDQLVERSADAVETFEGIDFLDFGLTMSSAKNSRENPNIGAFRRGYFDTLTRKALSQGRARRIKGGD